MSVRLMYYYMDPQHIEIKILELVYFDFGKLQSNTFTERIPKLNIDGLENKLNHQSIKWPPILNMNVSARCIFLTLILLKTHAPYKA